MDELTHDARAARSTPQGTLHYHEAGDGPPLAAAARVGAGRQRLGELPRQPARVRRALPHARARLPRASARATRARATRCRRRRRRSTDFLDGLELGRSPIVGNSMGGNVAARIAANHPDRVESPGDDRRGRRRRCSARGRPRA